MHLGAQNPTFSLRAKKSLGDWQCDIDEPIQLSDINEVLLMLCKNGSSSLQNSLHSQMQVQLDT
jgi:hypothetical protein